jgi:hypothetical protein
MIGAGWGERMQITAVLTSITEMLDSQGLHTSPVALYAALMATLQQTADKPEVQPSPPSPPSSRLQLTSAPRPHHVYPLFPNLKPRGAPTPHAPLSTATVASAARLRSSLVACPLHRPQRQRAVGKLHTAQATDTCGGGGGGGGGDAGPSGADDGACQRADPGSSGSCAHQVSAGA